ncbi:MAG: tRNA (pseudouridine(54)-N(1))-methyltransferase TrmY [Candidatus Jordarchaeum sp.]|uniref:tRNA (pseudouridine(54)-N(1))-methyltransferase TrmY n=1 Tax=Candidatus Jordarchaeum sp. TaxID=2823881 RepID=UPI00404945CB
MKRVFILKASKTRTDNKFTIKDLPGSGGRMDLVCRCILSALLLSKTHRVDTVFYAVLEGPPRPPLTIEVDGEKVKALPRDELQLASVLRGVLDPGASSFPPGFKLINKNFQEIIEEQINKSEIYLLHKTGNSTNKILSEIQKIKKPQITFILGDHIGLSQNDFEYLMEKKIEPLNLGKKEYLGSHCIFLVHEKLNRILEPKTA